MLVVLTALFYAYATYPWWPEAPVVPVYTSSKYGVTFSYPDTYALQERELGNAERWHHSIVLINKEWLAKMPDGGEGPPAIGVDIYQNNLDKLSLEEWVRGTSLSNFKLSTDGKLSLASVAGAKAFYYQWDGLYRGESYVTTHSGNIVVFSATYNAEDDQIRKDFREVLGSVSLY
jgi:hypothetical protein